MRKEGIRIEVRNIDGRKEWGSKDSLREEGMKEVPVMHKLEGNGEGKKEGRW